MKWYEESIFYHIYPIGLCGCAKQNDGITCENHFEQLNEWSKHVKKLGCNGIYIGPLFESVGHGYETTDYKLVDRRLGTNDDFKNYVKKCHNLGIKVIVDGVFNHVGREFFAFKDLLKNRENSPYKDWFCNVNFYNNNEYNDGFSYDNWGGYNLLVKLNQRNPQVKEHIFDAIRFWVNEFDIDGIRLDAADVLDHDFMQEIRTITNTLKEDFWLMGEVIHGTYSHWANDQKLHSVTNYELHKALYSGFNDHNFFEIAHSIQRSIDINKDNRLYTFVDNHDVERIASKLNNKAHLLPVHVLYYGLAGIPSIYYGSEFGIEGRKDHGSDDPLRPMLSLENYANAYETNPLTKLICKLGKIHQEFPELTQGRYQQLHLTNRQFAYGRILEKSAVIVASNNDDNPCEIWVRMPLPANKAIDLLKADFSSPNEEERKQLEEKQKDFIFKNCKLIIDKISNTHSIIGEKLISLSDTINTASDLSTVNQISKENHQSVKELVLLYDELLRAQNIKQEASKNNFHGDCQVRIEADQLVIKLDGNQATMIRIFNE